MFVFFFNWSEQFCILVPDKQAVSSGSVDCEVQGFCNWYVIKNYDMSGAAVLPDQLIVQFLTASIWYFLLATSVHNMTPDEKNNFRPSMAKMQMMEMKIQEIPPHRNEVLCQHIYYLVYFML